MNNRRVTFLLVIMIVLLLGNVTIHTLEYKQREKLPQMQPVKLLISGLDHTVSEYIQNTIRFPGFLKRGEQRVAILNEDIVFVGETVTVKVIDIDYRLLVTQITPEVISLRYVPQEEKRPSEDTQ